MGNTSNREQWAVKARLRYVESCAWWRGVVNRHFLADYFGLSLAQISSDLQTYHEMNPGALHYNLKRKRYEGMPDMKCVLHKPSLEEAMRMFLPGGDAAARVARLSETVTEEPGAPPVATGEPSVVEVLQLPERPVHPDVARRMFLAVLRSGSVQIEYNSIHGGGISWRTIQPHAFAHDGSRWHVRAWCHKNAEYRDFSLCRMSAARWPDEESDPPPATDDDWNTWVTLTLKAHRGLPAAARSAVELDYGMSRGKILLKVRKAMENYLRHRLGLPLRDGTQPAPRLELAE
jgi:predicted DNA-binding transcriptional regulator YafY